MGGKRLKLKARTDFVQRLTQAAPLDALEELIWNAFDESAKTVTVRLSRTELDAVDEIMVEDDGKSLDFKKAQDAFENLGNSNKLGRRLETGERLHGSKGEGRHKSLSLGGRVQWHFVCTNSPGNAFQYCVEGKAGHESPFYLFDEERAPAGKKIGCVVTITNISKSLNVLLQRETRLRLASHFAPFLLRHPDRTLIFDEKRIHPDDVIQTRKNLRDETIFRDERTYTVNIQVVHWKSGTQKEILLCSSSGIPLHSLFAKSLSGCVNFSVFASCELFDELHEANLLSSIEMTEDRVIAEKIRSRARRYFRQVYKRESGKALQRLRDEGSYPYESQPETQIGRVEQRVFDLCAIKISRHLPSFHEKMDSDARKLLLRMVKESVSQNPTSIGKIIREVCKLPANDAVSFAELLENIPLNRLVQMASTIADRLHFLTFFESVVYLNPFERQLKERTELHRILAPNTWLFGEEYALGSDDENLRKILERHIKILGRDSLASSTSDKTMAALIKEFNRGNEKTSVSLNRIPDLMLWKKFIERRADEYEFVVVELKRPGVKIGRQEIAQIEDYARAVIHTPFADSERTRWVFILVSDDLDEIAEERAHSTGLPPYTIIKNEQTRYEIRVLPWSQIIRAANARHEFLRKSLDFAITSDQSLVQAEKKFADHLPKSKKAAK